MKNSNLLILVLATLLFVGCSSDDDSGSDDPVVPPPPTSVLSLTLNGLEPLSDTYQYEGWIMVNGTPVSTGKFNTTAATTITEFNVLKSDLDVATAFVLSIELKDDDSVEPSNTKILSGTFIANTAELEIDNVVGNFVDSNNPFKGSFVNLTPTDNIGGVNNLNDQNGIWFVKPDPTDPDPLSGTPGLENLPTLQPGWKYEGWVIFPGPIPVTTGQFLMASGQDFLSPYSGNQDTFDFPGEDFVGNLPGVNGDTTGLEVVISIEPDFITDPNTPFFLKPIGGTQGADDNLLEIINNINAKVKGTADK